MIELLIIGHWGMKLKREWCTNQIQNNADIHQFYNIESCFQTVIHNWDPKCLKSNSEQHRYTSMHMADCRRPLMDLLGCVFPLLIASVNKAFTRNNLYCLVWDEGIFFFPHPTPFPWKKLNDYLWAGGGVFHSICEFIILLIWHKQ